MRPVVPRIIQEFFPVMSGPANQALALSQGLEAAGVRSPVLTTTVERDARAEAAGVTIHRFDPLFALTNFRPSPALVGYFHARPATLVHVHGWRNPVSDGVMLSAWQRGIPVVLQAHGVAFGYRYSSEAWPVASARQIYNAAVRDMVIRAASVVVASTAQEADELHAYGFPRSRIAIIPIGVHPMFFSRRVSSPRSEGGLRILSVGRLGPRRNVEQLLKALAILRAWGVPAQLRVVGPEVALAAGERAGYRHQLEALALRLGVAGCVEMVGPRQGEGLLAEYHAADVFVSTTRYENFGQPVAEAAAAGLPIVATPTGVAAELLSDGEAGALVPLENAVATAVALRKLAEDPEARRAMGRAARRKANVFDWRRIVLTYRTLYENTIDARTACTP